MVDLVAVRTVMMGVELYLGERFCTFSLKEICEFVGHEQTAVLSERVVVVHGVGDKTSYRSQFDVFALCFVLQCLLYVCVGFVYVDL